MSGKVQVVVGGQYGSEAKGAVAAYLCKDRMVTAVRVAGPNAGHSVVDDLGVKWALRQIPVAAVSSPRSNLVIAAGSEIDPQVLSHEMTGLQIAGFRVGGRLFIDGQATLIEGRHQEAEAAGGGGRGPGNEDLNARIGSTAKGIGAARADRIWRRASIWQDYADWAGAVEGGWLEPINTAQMLNEHLASGIDVVIEGTQGFALGLHAGWYPFCTSSDCRTVDFLAMAGVAVGGANGPEIEPWVVLRSFPIRVAGNSGPMAQETTWDDLGLLSGGYIRPEKTTVTQRIRRVGYWDPELAAAGVAANGGADVKVALSMFDYWHPELAGKTGRGELGTQHWRHIERVEKQVGAEVLLLGTGPASIIDLRVAENGGQVKDG